MLDGGRLSLSTDAWSANNQSHYAAVTVHFIDKKWTQRSAILDVLRLSEPIHSGEYLTGCLLSVTSDSDITAAIFSVTRDNASTSKRCLSCLKQLLAGKRHRCLAMGVHG